MSNANQETIADIVKEMRTLGRLDEKSTDKIPRTLQALGLRTYADRIETAHQREVAEREREVAELRECLKEAIREKCPFTRMSCKHGETCDYECGTFKWRKALQDEGGAK